MATQHPRRSRMLLAMMSSGPGSLGGTRYQLKLRRACRSSSYRRLSTGGRRANPRSQVGARWRETFHRDATRSRPIREIQRRRGQVARGAVSLAFDGNEGESPSATTAASPLCAQVPPETHRATLEVQGRDGTHVRRGGQLSTTAAVRAAARDLSTRSRMPKRLRLMRRGRRMGLDPAGSG